MRIFVTGFGPFGDFPSNPSTVVVDGLRDCFECRGVELMTSTVDVTYAESLKCSKMANEELEADFVIHVGVQPNCGRLMLEKQSFSGGYISQDINGLVPMMNRCEANPNCELNTLETSIDCEHLRNRVLSALNKNGEIPIKIEVSQDPGRYLCAYIYYCSLHISNGRSLFVHIPPFDENCTPELIIKILKQILIEIYNISNEVEIHEISNDE